MQRHVWVVGVPEVFSERKPGCLRERDQDLKDPIGGLLSQQLFDCRNSQTCFHPCGDWIAVVLLDFLNDFAGVPGHQGLELSAVDLAALEAGHKLSGCLHTLP